MRPLVCALHPMRIAASDKIFYSYTFGTMCALDEIYNSIYFPSWANRVCQCRVPTFFRELGVTDVWFLFRILFPLFSKSSYASLPILMFIILMCAAGLNFMKFCASAAAISAQWIRELQPPAQFNAGNICVPSTGRLNFLKTDTQKG